VGKHVSLPTLFIGIILNLYFMREAQKQKKREKGFESLWLELVLTKEVLRREDMVGLAHTFSIKFFGKNWEKTLPLHEIGRVLTFDVPIKTLLRSVKEVLARGMYNNFLSYEECKRIYDCLNKLDKRTLSKLYINIGSKKQFASLLKDKTTEAEMDKSMLIFSLLQEVYGAGYVI